MQCAAADYLNQKHIMSAAGYPLSHDETFTQSEGVNTGTTILALSFDGGVVMAADTRTSAGGFIVNRASRKISKLDDRIFVCRSGSAADTQTLTAYVKRYLFEHRMDIGERPRVNAAANLFKLIAYHNKDYLTAGLIVAGYDDREGGQVYSIDLGGTKTRRPYSCGGSGSIYVMGYLDATWKSGMTKDATKCLAKRAVAHAMSRDGSSGGMIRLVVITKDNVEEEAIWGDALPVQP